MLIQDIKSIITSLEVQVYLGELPLEPPNACAVLATGGLGDVKYLDDSGSILQPTFQILVRDESYSAGDSRVEAITNMLDGYSGMGYIIIYKLSDILPLGRDENKRWVFSVNFCAKLERMV